VVLSSDFEEVARVCNRALVFNRGNMVAELARDDISVARLIEFASTGEGHGPARRPSRDHGWTVDEESGLTRFV
jgi:ribose transport system ATP-binding protein